jgi:putative cell wall-binding protein
VGGRLAWRWIVAVVGLGAVLLPSIEPAAAVAPRPSTWPADAVPGSLLVSTSDGTTEVVRVAPGAEAAAARNIRRRAGVLAVEPDHVRQAYKVPNDARYGEQWSHTVARAPAAWDVSTGSASVRVAVIDTGIDATHRDLAPNVVAQAETSTGVARVVATGIDNDPCDDEHGTYVAGVIGAVGDNAVGVAGVAWRTSIVDVAAGDRGRCSGGFSDSGIIAAIRWAADPAGGDADILNLSLGSYGDVCPFALKGAVDYARSQGAVLVAASGNAEETLPGAASIPASCEGVVSVGAVGQTGAHAGYSSANAYVDVAAPGGDSQSGGGRILSTAPGGAYELTEGTSFASPYVAGAMALLKSVLPTLSASELERIVEGTTQGTPAARSAALGWGLLDVGAAVQAASSGIIPAAKANASLPSAAVLRLSAPTFATVPVQQAVAVSQYVFAEDRAEHVVLARPDNYADALGGSSLAYGVGPVLFTPSTGSLDPATESEIDRVLEPGGRVYILGGSAAIPPAVDARLQALGFQVVRLAGQNRMDTARLVASETVRHIQELGFPAPTGVTLVTALDWPDAVTAGAFGALFGDPVLLTAPTALSTEARAALQALQPDEVTVVGGTAVVSDAVALDAGGAGNAAVRRLAGVDRAGTAIAVAKRLEQILAFFGVGVGRVVAVNLRRADGFAHVLSATALVGSVPGIFLPVEGDGGTSVPAATASYACTLDPDVGILAGGADVIADATKVQLEQLLTHASC